MKKRQTVLQIAGRYIGAGKQRCIVLGSYLYFTVHFTSYYWYCIFFAMFKLSASLPRIVEMYSRMKMYYERSVMQK